MDSKMVKDLSSQPFPRVVVFGFLLKVIPQIKADEHDQLYVAGIIVIVFGRINYTIHVTQESFKPRKNTPSFRRSNNSRIYIETGVVVVVSYVLLLGVNWSYIWLAVFPLIAIGFIFTLCNKLNRLSGSQQGGDGESSSGGEEGEKEIKQKAERQEAAALVLYWVLCIMGSFHISDSLAISQFLLFFSFMLGTTRMLTRLALTGASPGVAQASVLLRKASVVVLLVTVHAVAAELLGENVVLFILPELAPILLWFSIHLDRNDDSFITADKITSHRNVITVFGAASAVVFASLAASMDELVFAWCAKALVSCGVSGLLVYYIVYMLCQWPGVDSTAAPFVEEVVKILRLWANTLLLLAATLLVFVFLAAIWLGLLERMVAEPFKFFSEFVIPS